MFHEHVETNLAISYRLGERCDKKRHTFWKSWFCKVEFANTTLYKKGGARVKKVRLWGSANSINLEASGGLFYAHKKMLTLFPASAPNHQKKNNRLRLIINAKE
jgi:hypothetical protein